MSDSEIIQGFRRGDNDIIRDCFYAYCQLAYCALDGKYGLRWKPGMDFYSLAHEYFLHLQLHDWRQLTDRPRGASLKSWLMGGFRFLTLDKLKEVTKEGKMTTVIEGAFNRELNFDVADVDYQAEVRHTIEAICHQLGRDSQPAIILRMLLIDGYKGKEVAQHLGITPSAVSQQYRRLLREVVGPYFRANYVHAEGEVMPRAAMLEAEPVLFRVGHAKSCSPARLPATPVDWPHRITPPDIRVLLPGEVFVFGSNLAGMHGGGTAHEAFLRFGAVMGKGVGLQGQSYAIPTMQGGVDTIRPYVDEFIRFAADHPELKFFVTAIGCGMAGFSPQDIAPLFRAAYDLANVCLPREFWAMLGCPLFDM